MAYILILLELVWNFTELDCQIYLGESNYSNTGLSQLRQTNTLVNTNIFSKYLVPSQPEQQQ